jgi:glycerol-3-phosphate acyltransferase PlsY
MTQRKGAVVVLFAVWVMFVLLSAYFSVTSFSTPPSETMLMAVFVTAVFIVCLIYISKRFLTAPTVKRQLYRALLSAFHPTNLTRNINRLLTATRNRSINR